ncbi:LacI family DNA-binding transcriptional regulator [Marinicrinis sediminis]|uniref:LacI family DNA-binding transcriptional regulator n=1 Tax=Marinicrinis sediminis TaxID=1652465 RepID=A0ABW5RCT0_9BACL
MSSIKKVTLQMIADKLGVSKALVSKALSHDPAVNDGTRETIWKTAEELGYRLKPQRKKIAAHKTGNIVVIVPRAYFDESEYWGKIMRGIDKELMQHRYSMIVSSVDIDRPASEGLPLSIQESKADGAIVMGHLPAAYMQALRARHIPYVMVDANVVDPAVDHVLANNFIGGYQVGQQLLHAGHRRLAFVGDAHSSWSFRERFRGFSEAVQEFNRETLHSGSASLFQIEGMGTCSTGMYTEPTFADALKHHLTRPDPVTALFFANDFIIFEALRHFTDWGIRYPQDVSLIGFDNHTLTQLMKPAISTVSVPKTSLGQRAAEMIVHRIEQPERTPEHVLLSSQLVDRESVLPGPASD